MSTKPSDPVRWAADRDGNDAANITVPTLGQQDTGWLLGQKPSSGLFNWLANRSYRWLQWLADGDCQFHDLSATGTLDIAGGATLRGGLDVAGPTTLGGPVGVVGDTTVARTLTVAGNTSIGGTLGVTGDTTLTGALAVSGPTRVGDAEVARSLAVDGNLTVGGHVAGPLACSGPVTASAGITVGANQNVVLSGSGRVVHDPMSITYAGGTAVVVVFGGGDNGPVQTGAGVSFFQPDTLLPTQGKARYYFSLPAGTRLLSWSLAIFKQTDNTRTLTARLLRAQFGEADPVGTTQTNSANDPGTTTIGESALNHSIIAGSYYYVEVGSPGSGPPHGTDQTSEFTITWDQPPLPPPS